jgi:hypothetical protein
MKLSAVLLAAAATVLVRADDQPGTVSAGNATAPAPAGSTAGASSSQGGAAPAAALAPGASPLDALKQKSYGSEYHMPFVRVVQARVQSDKPQLVKGRFVSKFGNGDLELGYRSAMDTVNMASVEGALMYVQAEGINQNSRAALNRCNRKNDMNYIVLYELLIAQTNETIAQFSDTWNVPEYGPMIPMDSGRCTPLKGDDVFPPECLQMNGDKGQPNIGPFIGAGLKNDDIRAPYPNTFWFSYANTCPLKIWGEKSDANNACRASTRKGLCDIGQAPDGVNCTYSYDILGWVPIDDVVGITSMKDDNGKPYKNFTTWCQASTDNIEFAGDDKTGKMDKGLDFWMDPLNSTRNNERATKVIDTYFDIMSGDFKSSQIDSSDLKSFKNLPKPDDLEKKNPPCYKTVPKCNTAPGCKRSGFSQICVPCKDGQNCKTDSSFTFPTLAKAKTALTEAELTSGSKLGGAMGAMGSVTDPSKNGGKTSESKSASSASSGLAAPMAAMAMATLAVLAL